MNYDSSAAGRQASSYSQSRRAMLRGAMAVVTGVTAATQRASAKSESLALPPVTKNVTPFKVEVEQAALDDLNHGTRDCFGTPLDRIQELVSYWQNDYEWRDAEAKLNAFPQFSTEIDGLGLHFLHVRSIARAGSSLDRR